MPCTPGFHLSRDARLVVQVGSQHQGVAFHDVRGTVFVAVSLSQGRGVTIMDFNSTLPPTVNRHHGATLPAAATSARRSTSATRRAPAAATAPAGTDVWDRGQCSSLVVTDASGHRASRHQAGNNSRTVLGTRAVSSGRATWKLRTSGPVIVGVATHAAGVESYLGSDGSGWGYDGSDGQKSHAGWSAYAARFGAGEVTVSVDMDRGELSFDVGGAPQGIAFTDLQRHTVHVACSLAPDTWVNIESFTDGSDPDDLAAPVIVSSVPSAAAGAGGAGAGTAPGAAPSAELLPLEFDPARCYPGIRVNGARVALDASEQTHSRTAIARRGYRSGRRAWNVKVETDGVIVGCAVDATAVDKYLGAGAGYGYDGSDGQIAHSGSWSYFGTGFRRGDVVTVVVDFDVGTVEFLVNDVPQVRPAWAALAYTAPALTTERACGVLQGVAGRDVREGCTMYPAVSLAGRNDSAVLMECLASPPPPTVQATSLARAMSTCAADNLVAAPLSVRVRRAHHQRCVARVLAQA